MSDFAFKIEKGIEVPAIVTRETHPFPWDKMKAGESFAVPRSYWSEQRGQKDEDYKVGKARERIRAHFRGWQEKDSAKRSKFMVVMREDKPDADGKGEGLRVWLRPANA